MRDCPMSRSGRDAKPSAKSASTGRSKAAGARNIDSPSLQEQAEARFMRRPVARTPRATNETPTKSDPAKRDAFMHRAESKYETKVFSDLTRSGGATPQKPQKEEDRRGTPSKHAQRDAFLKRKEDETMRTSRRGSTGGSTGGPSLQQQAEARFMRKSVPRTSQPAGVLNDASGALLSVAAGESHQPLVQSSAAEHPSAGKAADRRGNQRAAQQHESSRSSTGGWPASATAS